MEMSLFPVKPTQHLKRTDFLTNLVIPIILIGGVGWEERTKKTIGSY